MANSHLTVSDDRIAGFRRQWKITEMSLFGSVVREDFRPDSDIGVLVSFEAGAGWSLFDLVTMPEELAALLGRPVDLVAHSEIPWRQIVSQRNVPAHEYGEISQERIWLVATPRIPELIGQLDTLLPPTAHP